MKVKAKVKIPQNLLPLISAGGQGWRGKAPSLAAAAAAAPPLGAAAAAPPLGAAAATAAPSLGAAAAAALSLDACTAAAAPSLDACAAAATSLDACAAAADPSPHDTAPPPSKGGSTIAGKGWGLAERGRDLATRAAAVGPGAARLGMGGRYVPPVHQAASRHQDYLQGSQWKLGVGVSLGVSQPSDEWGR